MMRREVYANRLTGNGQTTEGDSSKGLEIVGKQGP